MTDLIPLDAAIAAITLGRTITQNVRALQAIPAIDPAAIREAALREALSLPKHAHTSYGAMRPDDLGCWVHTDDLTALIGEKK